MDEIIYPMRAKKEITPSKVEEFLSDDNYILEEKFRGERILSVGGRFFGPNPSTITRMPLEKIDNTHHLHSILKQYPLLLLDGKMYLPPKKVNIEAPFCEDSCNCSNPNCKFNPSADPISYMVFDILRDREGNWLIDLKWDERRKILKHELASLALENSQDPYLSNLRIGQVYDGETRKRAALDQILAHGGEGIVFKKKDAKYIPGQRPEDTWITFEKGEKNETII